MKRGRGAAEAFFARTLSKPEQKQLNTLLRKLLLRASTTLSSPPTGR